MSAPVIFSHMELPAILRNSGTFTPAGFGLVEPADPTFLDLDNDFPSESGASPLGHGEGTLYQLPTSRNGAIHRAWTLHAWPTLNISGTVSLASQMFVSHLGAINPVYRSNPVPAGSPVGGLCTVPVSATLTMSSTPRTIGAQRWAQFVRQSFLGRSVHYGTWPGQNHTGNISTQAQLDGDFDLDWITPMTLASGPIAPPPSFPSGFGEEICRISAIGNYNFYLGSDISSWDGSPGSIPTPTSVSFDVIIRGSLFANCGCVRYRDPISGIWQYPALIYFMLSASVEPGISPPGIGYYGSPPIAPDTDGFRATEAGLLKCCTVLSPAAPVGTFVGSGVSARFDLPSGTFLGDVEAHNYSESFTPDPTAGDNGWGVSAVPWQSHADLTLEFQDPISWQAPPAL